MFPDHLNYFQNLLLEVGLTQNPENHGTLEFPTIDLFYFIVCGNPT